ncbi:hypothetical protein ATCC90586_008184 [Pythium insidiosum]|nr:hypothetical protein ATCC90586_008184 [Pythium insidiosum]
MNLRLLLAVAALAGGASAVVDRNVHRALQQNGKVDVITFWISPVASLKSATPELVAKLAELPGVESIREELRIELEQPLREALSTVREPSTSPQWGVKHIGAPQVWAEGATGEGVVVGVIDSGARAKHEILKHNFVGKYGWFDPEKKASTPYDSDGHGSHVLGTIAGADGFGVAPAAKWMMCKGCRTEDCPESDLLDCAQFILCPTDTNGNNPDCSKAPRIVSNSWGGGQGDFWYKAAVDAWIKAGIVPVFAVGNDGEYGCRTTKSPGDYPNVIGVGSTTKTNELSLFSSRGPARNGRTKPDISAPGSEIMSASSKSDNAYVVDSGTSMATPHVSGAIALLLSKEPGMTFDDIKNALYTTVTKSGLKSGVVCGATSDRVWPNNQFGSGLLNISKAGEWLHLSPRPTIAPTPATPAPQPTTPLPEPTTAPPGCMTASGAQCGSDSDGVQCCPKGEYCQPWNPWFYQCRPMLTRCGTVEVNVDYYGDDIKTIKGVLPGDCCNECGKTRGCTAFTFINYNADGQSACYLKKSSSDKRQLIGAVSSTVTSPLPKCYTYFDVDLYGEDLQRVEAKDAGACCDNCESTPDCKAFTFVDNAWDKSACYLKKAVGTVQRQMGAISGVLN